MSKELEPLADPGLPEHIHRKADTDPIAATYFEDYNDNDEFFGKVQAQLKLGEDIGYDVVTPTDWMAARWIRLGYTQKFDGGNIPNASNILDTLASPSFDPKREQTLPWQGIMSGFGWNVDKNPKGIRTLEDLFAPQNKGKIVVLSELRDTIGVILLAQGVDVTKVTEAPRHHPALNHTEYMQR